jgi:hypothetical protein
MYGAALSSPHLIKTKELELQEKNDVYFDRNLSAREASKVHQHRMSAPST